MQKLTDRNNRSYAFRISDRNKHLISQFDSRVICFVVVGVHSVGKDYSANRIDHLIIYIPFYVSRAFLPLQLFCFSLRPFFPPFFSHLSIKCFSEILLCFKVLYIQTEGVPSLIPLYPTVLSFLKRFKVLLLGFIIKRV